MHQTIFKKIKFPMQMTISIFYSGKCKMKQKILYSSPKYHTQKKKISMAVGMRHKGQLYQKPESPVQF